MKEQLFALYELQSLDIEIAGDEKKLADLTGARAYKQQLAAGKAALETVETELAATEAELRDCELELKSLEEKRQGMEKRMYEGRVSSPKELSALEKEIGILKKRQGDLDGKTLDLYELVETSRSKAKAGGELVAKLETRVEEQLSHESEERAELESELTELRARREEAVKTVTDRALLSRYEAVRKRTAGTGIAKVVDGNKCEGCHVQITTFIIRQLFADAESQTCENCGRILLLDTQ